MRRHRIPFTLILPFAIPLLLELAVGKKKKVNLFQMRPSVPGILLVSPMKDFLKSAQYLKSGRYGDSVKKKKLVVKCHALIRNGKFGYIDV